MNSPVRLMRPTPGPSRRQALKREAKWLVRNSRDHLADRAALTSHGFCMLGGLQHVGWQARKSANWVQARVEAMATRRPEIVSHGRADKATGSAS